MKIIDWEQLPENMQTDAVKKYYDILKTRRHSLMLKRIFDLVLSVVSLVALSPVYLFLAIAIKIDSPGPVIYRQERITQYGRSFYIHKFRTMIQDADKGSQVTVGNDVRITRVGKVIRDCRLDEIAQLIDVIQGTLTLVGARPESPKYVAEYSDEMMATLLLPAGVTSLASIYYKDEAKMLEGVEDADKVYVEKILPEKMYYNLRGIEKYGFWNDIKIMFMTVFAVLGKEYKGDYVFTNQQDDKTAEEKVAVNKNGTI